MRSSSTRRIRLSDIEATPWKNGGGVTKQIATGAARGLGRDWGWRVSIAEVDQDGPFSIFPGTDRVIAVIAGDGMDLIAPDGLITALDPLQAIRICGDEPLTGVLRSGPVRDLNIMVRRDEFEATLDFWKGPLAAASAVSNGAWLLIHNLAGSCTVRAGGGGTCDLAPAETLVHEGQEGFEVSLGEDSRTAVISITPRQAI